VNYQFGDLLTRMTLGPERSSLSVDLQTEVALPVCAECRANPGPVPQVGVALLGPSSGKSPGHKQPSY
jgi:hypothetical protein